MLNVFELVRDVLDETYNEIPGTDAAKDAKIKALLADMGKTYGTVWQTGGPSFRDPSIRFAYVFKYVACHANLVKTGIQNCTALKALMMEPRLVITALGGGPGSDTLGVIKHLQAKDLNPKLHFHLCDREALWAETWSDLGMKLSGDIGVHTSYLAHDVLVPETWKYSKKFLQADLFTLIYFVSEVYAFKDEAEVYFNHVFANAKPGSHFLFMDNNSSIFFDWFDGMAASAGLEVVKSEESMMMMPSDEQMNVLKKYIDKFGSAARLKANVAYRVMLKP
jgi:hypothetical protein